MIKIGIVGGTGFTAGELLRILVHHPQAHIQWVYSRNSANDPVTSIHSDIFDLEDMSFTDEMHWEIDVLFLCLPHEKTIPFLKENTVPQSIKIIDLSRDFRLGSDSKYIYGLPELNRDAIKSTSHVANPGCFATSIQLALLPLASHNKLESSIHVTGITGSTGAGKALRPTTHFTWRNNNVSIYKALNHQHIDEIRRSLNQLQGEEIPEILFIPIRGDFTRGILSSVYTKTSLNKEEALNVYKSFYADHPFVSISDKSIDLKQIVNTNMALISIDIIDGYVHIVCAIDNLLKGASGQAVQNMNLIFGLEETLGLKLKSISY